MYDDNDRIVVSFPPKLVAGIMRLVLLSRACCDQQSSYIVHVATCAGHVCKQGYMHFCMLASMPGHVTGERDREARTVLMNVYPASLSPSETNASAVCRKMSADTLPPK